MYRFKQLNLRFTKRKFFNKWKLFVELREDKILKIAQANLLYKKTLKVCLKSYVFDNSAKIKRLF